MSSSHFLAFLTPRTSINALGISCSCIILTFCSPLTTFGCHQPRLQRKSSTLGAHNSHNETSFLHHVTTNKHTLRPLSDDNGGHSPYFDTSASNCIHARCTEASSKGYPVDIGALRLVHPCTTSVFNAITWSQLVQRGRPNGEADHL